MGAMTGSSAAASCALIWTARTLRGGRVIWTDAVFPMLLLHPGNWENLVRSWQLDYTISVALIGRRFVVDQSDPGFCHNDTWTCWGPAAGLSGLEQTLHARKKSAPEGSYSKRLFTDPALLAAKLREEADELARAESTDEIAHEAADVIYFTMARMAAAGVSLEEVGRILDRRALKITRRPGDAKT